MTRDSSNLRLQVEDLIWQRACGWLVKANQTANEIEVSIASSLNKARSLETRTGLGGLTQILSELRQNGIDSERERKKK